MLYFARLSGPLVSLVAILAAEWLGWRVLNGNNLPAATTAFILKCLVYVPTFSTSTEPVY